MSKVFLSELKMKLQQRGERETSLSRYVPYDQLNPRVWGGDSDPKEVELLFIESSWKPRQRPYHKQKLYWILVQQRCFALECAEAGYQVRYLFSDQDYASCLLQFATDEQREIQCALPAEYELRENLRALVEKNHMKFTRHHGWLTQARLFLKSQVKSGYKMDKFYRLARQESGILMDVSNKPLGGKYSYDSMNRKKFKGEVGVPPRLHFTVGAIENEVVALIESQYSSHPGVLSPKQVPTRRQDIESLWQWFLENALEYYGDYQDAMVGSEPNMFHALIGTLLHQHRLMPRDVCIDVEKADAPLNSREGFIRQVLGWREFMHHAHSQSDGFRDFSKLHNPKALTMRPNFLNQNTPLPKVFWGANETPSGLNCLDSVLKDVWRTGYSHHITRLMILSNIAQLVDIDPEDLSHWFWVAYVDAFDWVVEPNVIGMGCFALGDWMTTKPYISGAAYIDTMSDYCTGCQFHPKKDCPVTRLYWAYLERHQEALQGNVRLAMPLRSLAKRTPEKKKEDNEIFKNTLFVLGQGRSLAPQQQGLL